MTVTVRNLTRAPITLTVPPEIGGWQRMKVAVQVRPGKGPRGHRPKKKGVLVHDRRFPHVITLMAKGTDGSEITGQHEGLKTAPEFVAALKRRAIVIVDDVKAEEKAAEKPKPKTSPIAPQKKDEEKAASPAGSTKQ